MNHEFDSSCVNRANVCLRCSSCTETTSLKAGVCVMHVLFKGAYRVQEPRVLDQVSVSCKYVTKMRVVHRNHEFESRCVCVVQVYAEGALRVHKPRI